MLVIEQLSLNYQAQPVLHQVSFELGQGQTGCLLGPSGSGKSSLLRAIAGFEPVRAGRIWLDGRLLSEPGRQLAPEQRQVGMVFQDYALFPHLNVAQNIAFGLHGQPKAVQQRRVDELLALIGLSELATRFAHQLSGGQQQRVALARALAPKPRLLLLDEPFSGLDADLRQQLASDVASVLKAEHISALLVTHDQQEAFALADHIGVIRQGRLLQWATPLTLYHQPVSADVAAFVGDSRWLEAQVDDQGTAHCALGSQQVNLPAGRYRLLLRPEDVRHDDESLLKAQVTARTFCGPYLSYQLQLPDGQQLVCQLDSHHVHRCGEWIGIRPALRHWVLFAGAGAETAAVVPARKFISI